MLIEDRFAGMPLDAISALDNLSQMLFVGQLLARSNEFKDAGFLVLEIAEEYTAATSEILQFSRNK
ncbi:hypothetical protein ACV3J7_16650 [Salmonella enterica]